MSDYTGKTCPYCKTKLTDADDIVICSACDMPHHKDCWIENQGCTTFGCMGTIKNVDGSATSVTATQINYDNTQQQGVFCTRCGAINNHAGMFCTKCGNRLTTPATVQNVAPATQPGYTQVPTPPVTAPVTAQPSYQNTSTYSTPNTAYNQSTNYQQPAQAHNYNTQGYNAQGYNNTQGYNTQGYNAQGYNAQGYNNQGYNATNQSAFYIDPDVTSLIGQNQQYYVPKFQQMKSQNSKASWNWVAFLFTPYWFIYRKMYLYGGIAIGVCLLLVLIGSIVLNMFALGGYITFGILGNYIYMKHLEKLSVQAKSIQEPFKSQFIGQNGSTNQTATILSAIGYAILAGIFLFI